MLTLRNTFTIYSRSQQLDKAHARLDQVLNSNPNNPNLHFLKAQIYGYQRDSTNAEAELQKTLAIDSNYIGAYSSLAFL
jgi:Tfp pilus assembly protein PilF